MSNIAKSQCNLTDVLFKLQREARMKEERQREEEERKEQIKQEEENRLKLEEEAMKQVGQIDYISCDLRKPVFGVSIKVRFKPARMCRLVCAFVFRKPPKTGFLGSRPI